MNDTINKKVVVIGAGPIGLSIAIDLAQRNIPVIVLEKRSSILNTSRAICYSKESLAYFDKLGVLNDVMKIGVHWKQAKTYYKNNLVSEIDYQSDEGSHYPAFINVQQYYIEKFLTERISQLNNVDLRLGHELINVTTSSHNITLDVASKSDKYSSNSDYLIAADGVHSFVRTHLGLEFKGSRFDDKYLVIDFKTKTSMPNERRFWFNPTFSDGESALLLPQAKNVWRLDFQLGPNADDDYELSDHRLNKKIQSMFGKSFDYEILFSSIYRFSCKRMTNFRHKNIFFVGDAAHVVSPFGARGANSGFQDAENLAWRLETVINNNSPAEILDGYSLERIQAADQNIKESTLSTTFISPQSDYEVAFRNAILKLSIKYPFSAKLINCGKLYNASFYNNTDIGINNDFSYQCPDIRLKTGLKDTWLYSELDNFTIVFFSDSNEKLSKAVNYLSKFDEINNLKILPVFIVEKHKSYSLIQRYQVTRKELDKNKLACDQILIIRPDYYIGFQAPIDRHEEVVSFFKFLYRSHYESLKLN